MATIRKRGDRQWEARIRRKGHPTTCRTFETKAQAEAWVTVIESEMVRKVYVDRSEAERVTLGQALERYRREVLPSKKGHQEKYVIDAWQRHPLSARSLAEIRPADMAAYRDAREYEVSAKTIRLHLATISHLFTVATQEWGMGGLSNPVLAIRKPKLPQGRDRRLEGTEEARLLAACKQARSTWLAPLVAFALETGMRRGELLSVTWAQVDLDRRIARLEETKNGERRAVPLSSKAASILQALPRSLNGRVFPVSESLVNKAYRNAVKRAEIEGLTFHDLRHEATSRLFERGLDVMEVAAITGHKTLQMLKRYTHLRAEDLAKKLG